VGRAILIFGNTNAGKTTLGMLVSRKIGCKYVSFGDQKRAEMKSGSALGLRVEERTKAAHPIDPNDCAQVMMIASETDIPLAIISGFPICEPEMRCFLNFFEVVGVINILVKEETALERSRRRGVCPICAFPGCVGGSCPEHPELFVPRSDHCDEEFKRRAELYRVRILPFVSNPCFDKVPRIDLDSDRLSANDMLDKTLVWIQGFLK